MMFKSLRTRLTVLYAALFGVTMLVIACAVYLAITSAARQQVDKELTSAGAVFDRIWTLRATQLADGATVLSRDFGFRAAVATEDAATVTSALDNLRGRLKLDVAFVVGADGAITGLAGVDDAQAAQLWSALDGGATEGILKIKGAPYQAISAPILAPDLQGWVVFAMGVDRAELRRLETLSSIPLNAAIVTREGDTWRVEDDGQDDAKTLAAFTARAVEAGWIKPRPLNSATGTDIALVKQLRSFDGEAASVLVLRYPLALAMAPYRPMLASVLLVGLAGLACLIAGSWLLARSLSRPVSALDEAAHRLQDGETIEVPVTTADELGRLAASFNAMAAGIKDRELRITAMALTDQETGLGNRRALEAALQGDDARIVAVLGIERYHHVRAALGYHLTSEMVRKVGQRLEALRPGSAPARLSSERLGVLLEASDIEAATSEIGRILADLEKPMVLEGAAVDVAFSVGLAMLDPAQTIPAIERASIALDQARGDGRRIAAFDPAAYGDPASKLSLMSEMLAAMEDGSISLYYQPKHNFRTGAIDSAEALIRWRHPTKGMVSPDIFVTLAEETGHIRALTWWTLDRIIADQAALRAHGHNLVLAMNLSGRMVGEAGFADRAITTIHAADAKLCIEITETAVIGNPDVALEVIEQLRAAGVRISIDDYGSGMSSLTYLRQIPADELKIDKSFVLQLTESSRDALLVKSTVDLAHSLGLKLVAEGVETRETLAVLELMGCDVAQGYFIARPMALDDLNSFMAATPIAEPKSRKARG